MPEPDPVRATGETAGFGRIVGDGLAAAGDVSSISDAGSGIVGHINRESNRRIT